MKNKWTILILNILTLGLYTFYVASKLKVYEKGAWYRKWYYWFLGFIFGIIPGLVMFLIFYNKTGCLVSKKLNVPMSEYYAYPYVWILSFIVPVLGWSLFIVMSIYVHTWYFAYYNEVIKNGNEK